MYGEDIDLSYRISEAGYNNFYIGSSRVIHFKGESTIKDKSYLKNFYGALSIFYKKHFPRKKLSYFIIDLLIHALIRIKSFTKSSATSTNAEVSSWIYIGENENLFQLLKAKFPDTKCIKIKKIDSIKKPCDMIFFDSQYLGFSKIIKAISSPELDQSKIRIISKDGSFILGSDSSDERGVVIKTLTLLFNSYPGINCNGTFFVYYKWIDIHFCYFRIIFHQHRNILNSFIK